MKHTSPRYGIDPDAVTAAVPVNSIDGTRRLGYDMLLAVNIFWSTHHFEVHAVVSCVITLSDEFRKSVLGLVASPDLLAAVSEQLKIESELLRLDTEEYGNAGSDARDPELLELLDARCMPCGEGCSLALLAEIPLRAGCLRGSKRLLDGGRDNDILTKYKISHDRLLSPHVRPGQAYKKQSIRRYPV